MYSVKWQAAVWSISTMPMNTSLLTPARLLSHVQKSGLVSRGHVIHPVDTQATLLWTSLWWCLLSSPLHHHRWGLICIPCHTWPQCSKLFNCSTSSRADACDMAFTTAWHPLVMGHHSFSLLENQHLYCKFCLSWQSPLQVAYPVCSWTFSLLLDILLVSPGNLWWTHLVSSTGELSHLVHLVNSLVNFTWKTLTCETL